jgi:hypothetical protein
MLAALLLTLSASGAAAAGDEGFPGVQALMGEDEFRRAGLHTLNAQQLEVLDAWLLRYTAGDAQRLQDTPEVRKAETEFEVVSRIVGDFDGWFGDTVFVLEDGQRWQQRLDSNYVHRGDPNPQVRISRNFLGFFKLTILPDGRSVGVKQLP